MISKRRLWGILIGLFLFCCLAGFMYRASVFRISKNFDEVDPGKFYRSAQLTPEELDETIKKYGIRTVISLRGAPENSEWVKPEKEVLEKNGVKFIPASWTIDYFPDRGNFLLFAQALKDGPYPILVHCRTGADRTGEASAIYSVEFMHMSKDQAIKKNLRFDHWHVESFHPAKAEFVRRWKGLDEMIKSYDVCSNDYRDFAEPKYCPETQAGKL